jgi:hypothetical protein
MSGRPPSRLETARHRLVVVKRALAIASAAAFGVTAVWAHAAHPGTTAVPGGARAATLENDDDDDEGFGFGSGSLAPSTGTAPETGTHVS